MRKNLVMLGCVILLSCLTVLLVGHAMREHLRYEAMRKPEGTSTAEFREAIERFQNGETYDISVVGLRVGPEELAMLQKLDSVPAVNFAHTTITDADMELIASLPGLWSLDLTETRITDVGLAKLANHPTITELYLNKLRFTNHGLNVVRTIPNLRGLHLWCTNTTDATCEILMQLTKLETLSLDATMVTDRGIRKLYPLKDLKTLKIMQTPTSQACRKAIRRHWPKIELVE